MLRAVPEGWFPPTSSSSTEPERLLRGLTYRTGARSRSSRSEERATKRVARDGQARSSSSSRRTVGLWPWSRSPASGGIASCSSMLATDTN